MKSCTVCGELKELSEFNKDTRAKDGHAARCRSCYNQRIRESGGYERYKQNLKERYETDPEFREQKKAQTKNYRVINKRSVMLEQAKARAKRFALEFSLTLDDIVIPEVCPILGIRLEHGNIKKKQNSPSLDRVNNSRGYVKGNVRVISYLANHMKADASAETLLTFAANIGRYLTGDDIVRTTGNGNL